MSRIRLLAALALGTLTFATCGEDRAPVSDEPPEAFFPDDSMPVDVEEIPTIPDSAAATPDSAPGDSAPGDSAAPDVTPSDTTWTAGIIDRRGDGRGAATLTGVRAGRHDDYDRVVFTFAGEGRPDIHLEYVDRPVRDCGAGEVVPLAGDAWLAVRFTPANAHSEQGQPTAGPRELRFGLPVVIEAKRTCDFEAVVEYVLGVWSPNPYRVLELVDPKRVVVDVRHRR